jgi:hypothetical protein
MVLRQLLRVVAVLGLVSVAAGGHLLTSELLPESYTDICSSKVDYRSAVAAAATVAAAAAAAELHKMHAGQLCLD